MTRSGRDCFVTGSETELPVVEFTEVEAVGVDAVSVQEVKRSEDTNKLKMTGLVMDIGTPIFYLGYHKKVP